MKKILYFLVMLIFIVIIVGCGSKEKVTVSFENTNLESIEVDVGSKISRPDDPLKEGYIFERWYADSRFTKEFKFDTNITENTKIYAFYTITISKLLELGSTLQNDQVSNEKYYVKGMVKRITSTTYGDMTISDGENEIFVYGVSDQDGSLFETLTDKPAVFDTVYLYGQLKRFNNSLELNKATLVKFVKGSSQEVNLDEYDLVSISEARSLDVGSKVMVEGVVASITYGQGRTPNGVYLVDDTNSIYIYGNEVASSVTIGNKIKVAGSRTNYILDTEKALAEKFGYQGAIQIDSVVFFEKLTENVTFASEWITEKTIKEIMETDYTKENITTTIFKVNAFIKKVPGTGFTNYYFYDLDNETGSYTYTMNNGSDFSWLDQYDGKLMTLYLSVINAKSSNSGILYRFLPIKILHEYEYKQEYNSEFAVKYYGIGQFESKYIYPYSPDKELVTNVTSSLLGIEGVNLSYTSSNEDVAYFEEVDGKLVFKTKEKGMAIITIVGEDDFSEYSSEVVIMVVESEDIEYITVEEATMQDDETVVTVIGIVAASLVNQTGFYLIDETGIIAVRLSGSELAKVNLGNKVIIRGKKTHIGTKYADEAQTQITALGQLAIVDAEVLENQLGNHDYPTNTFIEGYKLADLTSLNVLEEHSTEVYVIEAVIKYEATAYYTRYSIVDENNKSILIYSSNANQLNFLEPFHDQKVTLELAFVNWNGNGYRGSILAVIHEGVKTINNSNFR